MRRVLLVLLVPLAAGGCFPRQAGPELAHFAGLAPRPGEPAPEIALTDPGGARFRLSERPAGRPLVVQLGSHSCPVYRYRRFDMRELWEEYAGRVDFVVVYTVEAHPVGAPSPYRPEQDEWDPWINRLTGVRVAAPASFEERRDQAARSAAALALPEAVTVVVDGMDDAVWRRWGAAPSPAFVVGGDGRVELAQPWLRPAEIRRTLDRLLAAGTGGAGAKDDPPME